MNIEELFEFALTQGCGVNLTSFKRSKIYTSLLKKQETLLIRYPADTDEGKMLRAGHLVSGTLLNCFSEDRALSEASTTYSKYGHGVEMRAMIGGLGKALITAAKKNLPDEAHVIAKQWKSATADEQVELTKQLYYLFQTEGQQQKTIMSSKNLFSEFRRKIEMRSTQEGFNSVMPAGYGKWNKNDNRANCQGKTQMILAFAEMVGAKALMMSPNRTARDVLDELKQKKAAEIKQDIDGRSIAFPDPEFMDSLDAGILIKEMEGMRDSFHVCPVIQVKDGRWIVIDSNSLNWGILSEEWDIEKISQKISKYREVLPGLSVVASAPLELERGVAKINQLFTEYLSRSKKLEELLQPLTDFIQIVEAFVDSGEFDLLFEEGSGQKFPPDIDKVFKINIASNMLFGPTDQLLGNFMNDLEHFLQRKKDCVYTYYHCLALERINDRWNNTGVLVHPEAHFAMDNYYHVAIAALNSLGIDERVAGMSSFILDYCFCQTTLHNAMISKNNDPELKMAAKEAIRKLPSKHRLSKRFL
jgi:hypothetical protein